MLHFKIFFSYVATFYFVAYVVSDTASTVSAASSSDHHSHTDSLGPDLSEIPPGMLVFLYLL